ncbi:MAG: nucleotidyltransferase domain-containing protein [Sedimenticola sp.]
MGSVVSHEKQQLTQTCLAHLPLIQAIYLFGSWATDDEKASSDIDIALLLPVQEARKLERSLCHAFASNA